MALFMAGVPFFKIPIMFGSDFAEFDSDLDSSRGTFC